MASLTLPFLFEDSQGANMMKINKKECAIVCPHQDTPKTRIWLSNSDLIMRPEHVTTVKFYKNSSEASNFFEPKLLKESLSRVLVEFYPVAGRLARDENGRLEINCNGEGVLFVVTQTEAKMSDLGENFLPSKELQQLVPKVDYSSVDDTEIPLLLVQVTTFNCGGVSLGVGLHHNLTDGESATHFMTSWASVARGQSVTRSPFFDHTVIRARSPPTTVFEHTEYRYSMLNKNYSQIHSDTCIELLEVTPDQVSKLKDKAQGSTNEYFSTYEVLTTHIWRCASKARGLSNDQETKLRMAVDCRRRFDPQLPQGYFGNAIFPATPTALCGDLKSESFRESVYRVRKALKRMDNEYLRSIVDWLEQQEDFTPLLLTEQSCCNPNLSVISWMRLPFYELDFGWGKPLCMRPTSAYEGKIYILPKSPNSDDGKLQLFVSLERNHMEFFKRYFASMEY